VVIVPASAAAASPSRFSLLTQDARAALARAFLVRLARGPAPIHDRGMRIDTERLVIRSIEEADAEGLHRIFSDPEAMRFIPGGAFDDMARVHRSIARSREREQKTGLTLWAVADKATGEFMGQCGVVPVDGKGPVDAPGGTPIELVYHFARPFWGKGYATEAARAVAEYAFEALRLARLLGLTFPENRASQRVLEKADFTYTRDAEWYGMTMREYLREAAPRAG
jgi:ribosomal-protein-alanine N-acetyltransferase